VRHYFRSVTNNAEVSDTKEGCFGVIIDHERSVSRCCMPALCWMASRNAQANIEFWGYGDASLANLGGSGAVVKIDSVAGGSYSGAQLVG